ncbi:methyl-accepting chemotaxis protein [Aeribacillus sp. FSL K6-8394]|uniref:methyl-accepting chemotaxis protein n=1 Tax=Aeribacillus sp. FSL K6-8394 TaxID=2954570 RepID=UPI0030F75775
MFKKLQWKLTALITILLIFSLLVVFFTSDYFVQKNIKSDAFHTGQSIVKQAKKNLLLQMQEYEKILLLFSNEPEIVQLLEKNDDQSLQSVKETFQSFLSANQLVRSVYVANTKTLVAIEPELNLKEDLIINSRPWYKSAVTSPNFVSWSEPYHDVEKGDYVVTASKAITKDGVLLGVIGIDINLTTFNEFVKQVEAGFGGYTFLLDRNGVAIAHPKMTGKNLYKNNGLMAAIKNQKRGIASIKENGKDSTIIFETITELNWKIGVVYSDANLEQTARTIRSINIFIIIAALIVAFFITSFVSRSISKPILLLAKNADKMAEGDLSGTLTVKNKDEIGKLANSFTKMTDNIRQILLDLDGSVKELQQSAQTLNVVSEEATASSEEISVAIEEIAKGSGEQANSTEIINGQIKQLEDCIQQVNNDVKNVENLSYESQNASYNGLEKLNELQIKSNEADKESEMVQSVLQNLVDRVEKISDIVSTISKISDQTNLLALNASIEAARAGESGKGFAVVAEEVRNLAEQSAKATENIKNMIEGIQIETKNAYDAMSRSKKIHEEQNKAVQVTGNAFHEIAIKMEDLLNGIKSTLNAIDRMNEQKETVVESIENISAVTQQLAASAEEVSATTNEQVKAFSMVAEKAESLSEESNRLKGLVERFKL